MRIQPRRQILNIWSSLLAACYRDDQWQWGGRDGSNSISDAEQLLCLLYPATEIPSFALDDPDTIPDDIAEVLRPLGRMRQVGIKLIDILDDYLGRYTTPDGRPIFAAGSYLRSTAPEGPTDEQRELDVVDSYSMSLTLCLAALKYLRALRVWVGARPTQTERNKLDNRISDLEARIKVRLTAAMIGLVRGFVVQSVDPDSRSGQAMLTMFNQTGAEPEAVLAGVAQRLERVRVRLRRDVTLNATPDADLEDEGLLFECGWSWGIVTDAAGLEEEFGSAPIATDEGYATPRPYLYFTVTALDGINDLTSARTRELDLLDPQQRRLAEALQLRGDLAQRYWSAMARYGTGRWPLEDIPWRTSDGEESDYFSLCVSAVLIQDLINREANDDDLTRATLIFDELARRGRIIRRLTEEDYARELHIPGVRLSLLGSGTADLDDGKVLNWRVSDYAPVLLKRTLQAAQLSSTLTTRDRLLELAQSTMDHLELRAFTKGPANGLWDDADRIFKVTKPGGSEPQPTNGNQQPSWYLTERVIECLVAADNSFRQPPLRSSTSALRSLELLNEAEHLLNQKFLSLSEEDNTPNRTALENVEKQLQRARKLIDDRPGTAHSLCAEALRSLDELDFAGLDAMRSE
ncbi:SCO2524 family protein [Nocardia sp. BMG111209]|uniref:SCO2524 family protein n=1 Tax=Nocardia sp. BMG111209 TaxID=1160137 RepID=UPI0003AABA44|nr:SCO2524 family protein [Nocardia sp. BMG111209]